MLRSLFEWLDAMPASIVMRESLNGFTLLLTMHVVSVGLVAGVIIFWDMRLAGMALTRVPVSQIWTRMMLPWMTLGLVVNVGTGLALVYSQPMRYFSNFYFWMKIGLLVLAGVNALYFHLTLFRNVEAWEHDPMTPFMARMAGHASLVFWAGVIVTGRMIAYSGLVPAWWVGLELE